MKKEIEENIPLTETMFLVLLTMLEKNYGYGVSKEVEKITEGRVILGPGTLYGAINNLSKKGWIKMVSKDEESGKKEYIATETGKRLVILELERMKNLVIEGERKLNEEVENEKN